MSEKLLVANSQDIENKVNRLAWQVYEANHREEEIIVIGIEGQGSELSRRIGDKLRDIAAVKVTNGTIRLNKRNPLQNAVECSISIEDCKNKVVVLVDDVLNSGKTMMYAANHFISVDLRRLKVLVLVNRSHNNYPIGVDYSGMSLATTLQEHVEVELIAEEKGIFVQ